MVARVLPLRSEFESRPQEGKLAIGRQFIVQNLDQLYVLVSCAHKTINRDMTYTMCWKQR